MKLKIEAKILRAIGKLKKIMRIKAIMALYGAQYKEDCIFLMKYDDHLGMAIRAAVENNTSGILIDTYDRILKMTIEKVTSLVYQEIPVSRQKRLKEIIARTKNTSRKSLAKIYREMSEIKLWLNDNYGDRLGLYKYTTIICAEIRSNLYSLTEQIDKNKLILVQSNGWNTTYGHQGYLAVFLKALKFKLLEKEEALLLMVDPSDKQVANKTFQEYLINYASSIEGVETRVLGFSESENIYMLKTVHMDCWQFKDKLRSLEEAIDYTHKNTSAEKLTLFKEHEEYGKSYLKSIGFEQGDYVTIQIRDGEYGGSTGIARNSRLKDYIESIEYLISIGYKVMLIRNNLMDKVPSYDGNLYDYASCTMRDDKLDIFLIATSKFFVCNLSGPLEIANAFNVPVLLTNAPSLGRCSSVYRPRTICLPRILYDKNEKRLMTFTEMLSTWKSQTHIDECYDTMNYVPNTSREICNAINYIEAYCRSGEKDLRKYMQEAPNAIQLEKFNSIRKECGIIYEMPVDPNFLCLHQNLL